MASSTLKTKPRMFHAAVLVTRMEEWCVEAQSAEQARELLEAGHGHRCTVGDCLQAEIEGIEEA
jgi:hypothetical protein